MKKVLFFFVLVLASTGLFSQQDDLRAWQHLDYRTDSMYGVGSNRAYEEILKNKTSKPVVVAILDSGVDFDHEDLKDVMWVNPGEIPGNGIDDDKNGYVDDIHGWNFLGGKDGRNVAEDTYEVTRVYKSLAYKYETADSSKLNKKQLKEYALYKKVKAEVMSKKEAATKNYERIKTQRDNLLQALDKMEKLFDGKEITKENLDSIELGDDSQLSLGKQILEGMLASEEKIESFDAIKETIKSGYQRGFEYYGNQSKYSYNTDFDPRSIVGDDYNNSYEKGYGNNTYDGPDASHGTHVAGIVAAKRDNEIGMNGIANNVKIMTVRVVPDGDERDKDVANGIIYAADNGASIINMSFGKLYSSDKEAVDKAVKYAEKKDVLIIHAAGNDSKNIDEVDHFPVRKFAKKKMCGKKTAGNWMEVGALSFKQGKEHPAVFSNYGQKEVDVFAPGVAIYSTTPDDQYASFQGTSMAAPVVAGVAALVRSYYPELSAKEVKKILMESSMKIDAKVVLPGSADNMVDFSTLSSTGGVVNAYNALMMAGKK